MELQLQTNALTSTRPEIGRRSYNYRQRPKTGRQSTQNKYKQMLLQEPRQVDGQGRRNRGLGGL